MSGIIIEFDYSKYIANPQFAMYSDPTDYPEALLQVYWDTALNYISPVNVGAIAGDRRQYAIELMMSHLIFLTNLVNTGSGTGAAGGSAGTTPYQMQSSSIDKVSVSVVPPPNPDQFQWWLGTSPFGMLLLALLQIHSVGGQYIGGSNIRGSFRGSTARRWPWAW